MTDVKVTHGSVLRTLKRQNIVSQRRVMQRWRPDTGSPGKFSQPPASASRSVPHAWSSAGARFEPKGDTFLQFFTARLRLLWRRFAHGGPI
jgi:hypothetical protein